MYHLAGSAKSQARYYIFRPLTNDLFYWALFVLIGGIGRRELGVQKSAQVVSETLCNYRILELGQTLL